MGSVSNIFIKDLLGEMEKEHKWYFIGDSMFQCSQCREIYSLKQFQQLKNHIDDPDFPNYCPHCGSNNYKEEEYK